MKKLFAIITLSIILLGCSGLEHPPNQTAKNTASPSTASQWCNEGDSIELENMSMKVKGIEDYQGKELTGSLCHLNTDLSEVTADYYLDEQAYGKFSGEGNDVGNGCIVLTIKQTQEKTEMCFGDKTTK